MKKFDGVEDTLFIPLVGRIYASKNFKEFFYDEKALELESYIPLEMIKENTDEYFLMASLSRFYEFDNLVKDFITKYHNANIVCLGSGLETMYYRVKPSKEVTFYEVDFEDVIRQRKVVLGEQENDICIGSDLLKYSWMDKIDSSRPTLFIVAGVFQYLKYQDIVSLIKELKKKFNKSEIAFDATNKKGLEKANEYVEKTGNSNAKMYFYLDKPDNFIKDTNTSLIRRVNFYDHSRVILKKKLKLSTRFLCYFGDKLGFTKIIYLKIN